MSWNWIWTRISWRVEKTADRLLDFYIRNFKWYKDCRSVPLTPEHRDLYLKIHRSQWNAVRHLPNLRSPSSFSDKLQWLKLFDQDPAIIHCVDKLSVRDYVAARVGHEHLTRLLQVTHDFESIDFSALPESFVIKTTHDSGSVILVPSKQRLDITTARQRIQKAIANTRYGTAYGEWAYQFVRPRVLIEEHLAPEAASPPRDFKFHCCDGAVKFVQVLSERNSATKNELILNPDGARIPISLAEDWRSAADTELPTNFSAMKAVAEKLSAGFRYVRVDLYSIRGKVLFGELTFWPNAGIYVGQGQLQLGKLIDINLEVYKPVI